MPRAAIYAVLLLTIATPVALGQASRDSAIVNAMLRADRSLRAVEVWHRIAIDNETDLVLAIGASTPNLEVHVHDWAWLSEKVGIFLQERAQPGRLYTLSVADGRTGCVGRVIRATATDTVISCRGEKSEVYPNQKFVYEIRAKRLVGRFEYMPYGGYKVSQTRPNGVRFLARNDERQVSVDIAANRTPEIQVRPVNRAPGSKLEPGWPEFAFPKEQGESPPFGPSGAFKLVKDDEYDTECGDHPLLVLERQLIRYRLPPSMCDRIGPWAIEGGRLWFGRAFYSGEGNTGTGGFGYFDTEAGRFQLFSPPEVRPWAATAILVQPDAIWLALALHGEGASEGHGIVRFDRRTNATTRFDIGASIGNEITPLGDGVVVAVEDGFFVIRGSEVKGYIVDQTLDGRRRIAQAFR